MPKVSVIIPTYNRAEFLRAAIRSVRDQSFQEFEILVIDDCSKDHTADVVRSFADERIRYIRNDENKGEGGSRNIGLKCAQGELIALLDDDDEWLPAKLQLQVDKLNHSHANVGAVYTGYYRIERGSGKLWETRTPRIRGNVLHALLTKNWILPSSMMLRKVCFDRAGCFEEGMKFGADYDMWIRVAKDFEFECVELPLVRYYLHGNNVTANSQVVIRGIEYQLEKYAALWKSNRRALSHRYLTLGVLYCYDGQMIKGRTALRKAIALGPADLANYFNFCLALMGTAAFRRGSDIKERITTGLSNLLVVVSDRIRLRTSRSITR